MDCRVYLLIVALAALLISTHAAPTDCSEEGLMPSRHTFRVGHRFRGTGNTRQTVEDALNIPIAALDAVQRLLSNLFTTKTIEVMKS